jgi:hypothetical protein
MNAARRLVRTDGEWRIEAAASSEPPPDTTQITVDSTLLPPEAGGEGLWVGHDEGSHTTRFAGWGPALDRVSVGKEDMLALPNAIGDPIAAGLLMPACAVASALDGISATSSAVVVGEGLLADLASRILVMRGYSLEPAQAEAGLGLIVDIGGEPGVWAGFLPALHNEGALLLLVPPWSRPGDFDFYPQIHRRSLQVIARRWHRCPQPADTELVDSLRPIVSGVASEGRWLRPLDLKGSTAKRGVWQWLDWRLQETSARDEKHL